MNEQFIRGSMHLFIRQLFAKIAISLLCGGMKNGGTVEGAAVLGMGVEFLVSGGRVAAGVADLAEGAFDELFALIAEAVIDGGHGLDDTGGGACEGELAVGDFALVEGKGSIAEDDETAVGELAGVVFVEIKDDFFVGKLVVTDFHIGFRWGLVDARQ
jgi:hypothetical protein